MSGLTHQDPDLSSQQIVLNQSLIGTTTNNNPQQNTLMDGDNLMLGAYGTSDPHSRMTSINPDDNHTNKGK